MMFESLTDIFSAVAIKYLTAVDAESTRSNQHEIGGLVKPSGFGKKLGLPEDGSKLRIPTTMIYLDDYSAEALICEDIVSWYDSRFDDSTRGPEWRLYYPKNLVTESMRESDMMLIALTCDQTLLMIFCPQGSQTEVQLRSLFSAHNEPADSKFRRVPIENSTISAPIRLMLARYGIELDVRKQDDDALLEVLINEFGDTFPKTRDFSSYARTITEDVSPIDSPDETLLQWMDDEERIFRLLERHVVQQRLKQGFGNTGIDVDEFVRVSLSVQNRRKSRVGHAFENHIEEVLRQNGARFERGVPTDGKQKPDFLFPGRAAYLDLEYPADQLRILGAKTSCKERWRQVLAEANRIDRKHLITLEPAVSIEQTDQMRTRNLQLVVPTPIQPTYKPEQQAILMSFKEFIGELPKISG